jgi:hypothetical protein
MQQVRKISGGILRSHTSTKVCHNSAVASAQSSAATAGADFMTLRIILSRKESHYADDSL